MAEGARLESVFTGNRNVGSNPTPSASPAADNFGFVAPTKIIVFAKTASGARLGNTPWCPFDLANKTKQPSHSSNRRKIFCNNSDPSRTSRLIGS